MPCGHLLGKGWPPWLLLVMLILFFVTFPCGILCQVWYLVVSFPDLCHLSYFSQFNGWKILILWYHLPIHWLRIIIFHDFPIYWLKSIIIHHLTIHWLVRIIIHHIPIRIVQAGKYFSNTNPSDMSIVGTCDIIVYQQSHQIMWFVRLVDSNLLSICVTFWPKNVRLKDLSIDEIAGA